jgi:protein arginine kinase activator
MYFYDSFFIRPESQPKYTKPCPVCGATAAEIMKSGFVGCSECYKTFAALLDPYIVKIHGRVTHSGRVPPSFKKEG